MRRAHACGLGVLVACGVGVAAWGVPSPAQGQGAPHWAVEVVASRDAGRPGPVKARVMRMPVRTDGGPGGGVFTDMVELVLGFNPLVPTSSDGGCSADGSPVPCPADDGSGRWDGGFGPSDSGPGTK